MLAEHWRLVETLRDRLLAEQDGVTFNAITLLIAEQQVAMRACRALPLSVTFDDAADYVDYSSAFDAAMAAAKSAFRVSGELTAEGVAHEEFQCGPVS
jgi:hypothetical protein